MKMKDLIIDEMNNKKQNLINYDFQGHPEYALTIKDFIVSFGGQLNLETNKWEIDNNDILNIVPRKLEDDGMGYGVNEELFISCNINKNNNTCNIFVDKELEYINVWAELSVRPGSIIKYQDKEWLPSHIDETDEGFIMSLIEFNIDNFAQRKNNIIYLPISKIKELTNKQ